MIVYFAVLLVYLLAFPLLFFFSNDTLFSMAGKLLITGTLLLMFRKKFFFKVKTDFLALALGLVIFASGFSWKGYTP